MFGRIWIQKSRKWHWNSFQSLQREQQRLLLNIKEIIEKDLKVMIRGVQAFYKTCNALVESFTKELDKENITPESQNILLNR